MRKLRQSQAAEVPIFSLLSLGEPLFKPGFPCRPGDMRPETQKGLNAETGCLSSIPTAFLTYLAYY
jgi:hypothetical protein